MESNFIKERIVVRQQLIKKNIESEKTNKKKDCHVTASSSGYTIDNPPDRIVVIEEVLNEKLKQDLFDISQDVDKICTTIADYIKVKSALKIFKNNPRDIRVQTNIGCNFYAQCHIEDASQVYICVGSDYYLLMELDEAIKMVEFKEKQWTQQLESMQEKAAKIKAYIKIALEAMGRLYEVDRERLS